MNFDEEKKMTPERSQELEGALLILLQDLMSKKRGPKKTGILNKGFYYFFLRNRHFLNYSLGSGTFTDSFYDIIKDKRKFSKVLKAWSAKFNRYIKGSKKVISDKKIPSPSPIEIPTLGNQLSVCDFVTLTEGLNDKEILEILRGKTHMDKMLEQSMLDNEINRVFPVGLYS
jgi:hypothetical protein